MPRNSRGVRADVRFLLLASFSWNAALGMTHVLTPLYIAARGLTGVEMGAIFSLPVITQVAITVLGGALTDRIGGRRIAMGAGVLLAAGGILLLLSSSFGSLLFAQFVVVISRATFWPATWTLASRLTGETGRQMARVNGAANAGQVAGMVAAGIAIGHLGFAFSYMIMAAAALAASFALIACGDDLSVVSGLAPWRAMLRVYGDLARNPAIHYAILCSYIAALPLSLSFSFYPILLVAKGFDVESAGVMVSLRAAGGVASGIVAGAWATRVNGKFVPLACALGTGLCVAATSRLSNAAVLAMLMFTLGFASAVMMLACQTAISRASSDEARGSAMALGTLGGTVSNMTTPLVIGAVVDLRGMDDAFMLVSMASVVAAAGILPLRARAAQAGTLLGPQDGAGR